MPKEPKLAVEGRQRYDYEYELWAMNVVRDVEDIQAAFTIDSWEQHYRRKYPQALSPELDKAKAQIQGLWESGIKQQPISFKEAGVRLIPRVRPTGMYWTYINTDTNRFMKATDAWSRIETVKQLGR